MGHGVTLSEPLTRVKISIILLIHPNSNRSPSNQTHNLGNSLITKSSGL
jgi:hypothetical protein